MEAVSFRLNGRLVTADAGGRTTLLQYLRGAACLKGSKTGCGTGHCGACSVLIDGELRRSCVTPLTTLAGRTVETIEGVAEGNDLSVIQRSFLDAGAVQCGFCTPGMVMAATALLRKNPSPTEAEICEGLRNNYCRCTGYVKIVRAVELAAMALRAGAIPAPMSTLVHTKVTPQTATTARASRWYVSLVLGTERG